MIENQRFLSYLRNIQQPSISRMLPCVPSLGEEHLRWSIDLHPGNSRVHATSLCFSGTLLVSFGCSVATLIPYLALVNLDTLQKNIMFICLEVQTYRHQNCNMCKPFSNYPAPVGLGWNRIQFLNHRRYIVQIHQGNQQYMGNHHIAWKLPSCIMKARRETAADPPGAYIHDTSSAPLPSQFPPTPFQNFAPLQIWELLMY